MILAIIGPTGVGKTKLSIELAKRIDAEIINARFFKPFDENKIIESIKKTKNVITIEDGFIKGGLATTVNELIAKNGIIDVNIKNCGYDDEFVKQGSVQELEQINGLDCNSIVASWVKNENIVNEVLHG